MRSSSGGRDELELYTLEQLLKEDPANPAIPALRHLIEAWKALESLEAGLSEPLDRWEAESLLTVREGIRRAWLALSSLARNIRAKRVQGGETDGS